MRLVFADTLYWLAIFLPSDPWADAAHEADISEALLVTTEEVLTEFLTAVSAHGDRTRCLACRLVREILNDFRIEVLPSPTNRSAPVWRYMNGVPTSNTVLWTAFP